jgi:uncharacterized protein
MRNRLANASSPYLRQHADNPVYWQPWDEVALRHARQTDTPILVSIGYSACHWCHVMAEETFENVAIARVMNSLFINVKVDREERPDLDRVYQLAHQALSGQGGGWPLTVFLDPQDLTPFFAGTYFPPTPRHGLHGFPEVLHKVRDYYDAQRGQLRAQAVQLRQWLARASGGIVGGMPTIEMVDVAVARITERFDREWGGSVGAPKFPHAGELELLLDLAGELPGRRDDPEAASVPHHADYRTKSAAMARFTLQRMAVRGLQDHLGGGFFRYCVDERWTVPHFEKMLYDNAQLLPLYARIASMKAGEATGEPFEDAESAAARDRAVARQAANGIAAWIRREMTAPDGAFYSALSADSDGEEGKYYVWTREEIRGLLTPDEFTAVELGYGLDALPNFEERAWHLLKGATAEEIALRMNLPLPKACVLLAGARERMIAAREHRVRPARDDKILTAWNALAISGLARTARMLRDSQFAAPAIRALDALRRTVWVDGELYANVAEPALQIPAFLDDHALLLDALLEVMQLAFDPRDLTWAIALANAMREKFADREGAGFWFSSPEHHTPLVRGRSWTDDSLPNGNGAAIRSLRRLGHLLGDARCLGLAERALRGATGALQRFPDACPTVLRGLLESHSPRMQIVVRCHDDQQAVWRHALDNALAALDIVPGSHRIDVFYIPSHVGDLPGLLAQRAPRDGGVAYVCEGLTCRAPIESPRALAHALQRSREPAE